MSPKAPRYSPIVSPPNEVQSGSARQHAARLATSALVNELPPVPLPTDPKSRAELLGMIEEGLEEARAGIGVDADEVMARWDRMLAALAR